MKDDTRKKLRLFTLCCLNVIISMVASMQTPFYPREASLKGLTPSQFGFVFGIYKIMFCLSSLFYGKYMTYIGVSTVNITAMITVGITCFLFGFLPFMNNPHFYIFSMLIRLLEGMGNGAFVTSSLSIISSDFIENISLATSVLLSGYGGGLVIGPAVGGALYGIGGFIMPFTLVGSVIVVFSTVFALTLRSSDDCLAIERLNIFSLLKYPSICLSCAIMFCEYFTIGFLDVTLEPHVRPLNLNALEIGCLFMILGFTFSGSSPLWGYICDRWSQPNIVCVVGCLISCVMLLLIGPAPFFHLEMSLYQVSPVLFLLGFALGAIAVGTYSSLRLDSIQYKILKPSEPNCLISGVWIFAAGLGSFSGATIGGILYDNIGFAWTSVGISALHLIAMFVTAASLIIAKRRHIYECEKLIK